MLVQREERVLHTPPVTKNLQAHFNSDVECDEEQLYSSAPAMIPHSALAHESRGKESCRKASRDCSNSYAAFPETTRRN